jgi:NADH-quinone oxidoreductase subunit J
MTVAAITFFAVAFLAFLGALTLVFHRHPIIATLGMAVATVSIGVLYMMLHVPFLGLFQMIVYAGSVMVVALYIIMALGAEESGPAVGGIQAVLSFLGSLLLLLALYRVLLRSDIGPMPAAAVDFGSIQSFGMALVTKYAVPFELASLLLLGAMVGAVILSRRQWS